MKQIASRENPLFKSIVRLAHSARARREEGRIILDGIHLVQGYLDRFGGEDLELVVKRSAANHPEITTLVDRARAVTMSDSLFDQAAPVRSPVGVLAIARLPRLAPPGAERGFQVLLDGVQDPGNVGAILRSAAAAGASTAYLSSACADPWAPKALRGGMGAQFLLDIRAGQELTGVAATLDVKLIACTVDADSSVYEADLRGPVAFMIGGEGAGLSAGLLLNAHQKVRVPMRREIESLNAGVAAAICFYEWSRQNR